MTQQTSVISNIKSGGNPECFKNPTTKNPEKTSLNILKKTNAD
jgi:hypothetical protein